MVNKIPKIFHFVFGLKEQTEPFHLAYYLCLKSCLEVNNPESVHFYCHYQPYGKYWDLIKPHLTIIEVEQETFVKHSTAYQHHQEGQFIQAAKLDYAHQADFIRLKKLIEYGGVYADIDTLFVNPIPDELYQHPFVIGREESVTPSGSEHEVASLCNALLMSEPNSLFARHWLRDSYQAFDGAWSTHSCQLAAKLASAMPATVYIAPQRYFFKHMWTKQGISALFEELDTDFEQVYSMHMWNHLWWDESRRDFSSFHAALLTEKNIKQVATTYNIVARKYLPDPSPANTAQQPTNHVVNKEQPATHMNDSASSRLFPILCPGWELSQGDDENYLCHQGLGKTFSLNNSSLLTLQQCDGKQCVETIIALLDQCFPGNRQEIEQDVKELLRDLALQGTIEFRQASQLPKLTKPNKGAKLCIGMATYDDYDGVYFSIQAIRLYHPEVMNDVEFVVLDNNPTGVCAEPLKSLGDSMSNYRYVAGNNLQGTWSRFSLVNETVAPYILCIDSHVMIVPGALKRLLDYFEAHADTPDFLQGPLLGDDLVSLSSHFTPGWGAGMYGTWAGDPRADDADGPPFDIPMQGLGLFALRRECWPRINSRFNGFGGEEGYVHEKMRRDGGRTLCLPFLRWIHRFNRPMGTRYQLNWQDRIRNYMIAHDELGVGNEEMISHFTSYLGADQTAEIVQTIDAELTNPFYYFDAIYCINLDRDEDRWRTAQAQFNSLGIAHRVQKFAAIETPENHHIGCALSHRAIVQDAMTRRLNNVLVLEDDVVFDAATLDNLGGSIAEIEGAEWDVLFLGAHTWGKQHPIASGCKHLREVTSGEVGPTCTHAIAYNASSFAVMLDEFPDSIPAMKEYLAHHFAAIDQFLAAGTTLRRMITEPRVASQPALLRQEEPDFEAMM